MNRREHMMETLRSETLDAIDHDQVELLANKIHLLCMGVPLADIMTSFAAVLACMVKQSEQGDLIPVTVLALIGEFLRKDGRVKVTLSEEPPEDAVRPN